MIRAFLRDVILPIGEADVFEPDVADDFVLSVDLEISSSEDDPAAELFQMYISTPKWLATHPDEANLGFGLDHFLIVECFDYDEIYRIVSEKVSACHGETWDDVALQIQKFAYWEFFGARSTPLNRFDYDSA